MRGKRKTGLDFFAQPYDRDADGDINEMKLVEDAHLPIKQCSGVRDLTEGVSKEYDANAPQDGGTPPPAGGVSKEERNVKRSGAVLATSKNRSRNSPPTQRSKPSVPEDSGEATMEYDGEPSPEDSVAADPLAVLGLDDL
jgi:hypothetical protein